MEVPQGWLAARALSQEGREAAGMLVVVFQGLAWLLEEPTHTCPSGSPAGGVPY